jgi:putative hydrolase of HD superfamily
LSEVGLVTADKETSVVYAHEHTQLPRVDNQDEEQGNLEITMDFILSIDKLKQVRRRNPLVDGRRRERTAEHCWHVAAAAMCLHRYAAEEVDLGRAVQLAIIHDLPETVVGDTFVYGRRTAGRRHREKDAIRILVEELDDSVAEPIVRAWNEYEYESSAEGRFVMAIDVLLPIFINFVAGPDSSWRKYRVAAVDVRTRIDLVRAAIPAVAKFADKVVDEAVQRGLLAQEKRR